MKSSNNVLGCGSTCLVISPYMRGHGFESLHNYSLSYNCICIFVPGKDSESQPPSPNQKILRTANLL